jgi:hypothetical protein
MRSLLKYHRLNLIQARHKKIVEDTFENGLGEWKVLEGDWHKVTVDTNEDKKTGIEGDFLINSAGSYYGGVIERSVELNNYGEIVFERYIKNDNVKTGTNKLNFYIDNILKLSIDGPTPWRRIEPIGISPGKHKLKFEYIVNGGQNPIGKSSIFDTFTIWEGRTINTTIAKYTPPKPHKQIAQNKTLRGYTKFQEMTESDTEINFSAIFDGASFLEFMVNNDKIFYFVDEFGVCYRGIFPSNIEPESKALNSLYYINLNMICPQKVGVGFV